MNRLVSGAGAQGAAAAILSRARDVESLVPSESRSTPLVVVDDYNGRVMRVTGHTVAAAPESVRVGVLATVTMDAVLVAASRLGGDRFTSDLIGVDPVGRWAMGMMRGQVWHDDLPGEPPVRGEAAVGLAVHYMTGIALTQVYLTLLRCTGSRSSLLKATAYGAATSLLPLLAMHPSWGLGAFARRSPEAPRVLRAMLVGHTAFGAGIGIWTALLRHPAAR
jgi:hypothetical protein